MINLQCPPVLPPTISPDFPSVDFRLCLTRPAGPTFNLKYDGGLHFNVLNTDTKVMVDKPFDLHTQVLINDMNPPVAATVISVLFNESDVYTVHVTQDGSIHQFSGTSLSDCDHSTDPHNPVNNLPKWVEHDAPVTVFLYGTSIPNKGA